MLPSFGPWCDSARFTDPELLADIGLRSRDAAVGVLTNRNLHGPALARVAAHAHLSAANVDTVGASHLVRGRTVADQMAIFTAAHAKSQAVAERLFPHLRPGTVLALHHEATTTRMKGAAWILRMIQATVAERGWASFANEPAFAAVAEVIGGVHAERALAVKALTLMGDPQALRDYAPILAGAVDPERREFDDLDVNCLLLATAGHPDVVAHWAEHGGVWGRLVAALDHRQTSDFLLTLEDAHTASMLSVNPRIPLVEQARILGETLSAMVVDRLGGRALDAVIGRARVAANAEATWGDINFDDWAASDQVALAEMIDENDENLNLLMCFELLPHALATMENGPSELVDRLITGISGAPVREQLAEVYARFGADASYYVKRTLLSEFGLRPEDLEAEADWDTAEPWTLTLGSRHDGLLVYPAAAYLSQRLTTGEQYEEFFGLVKEVGSRRRQTTVGRLVAEALQAQPASAAPSGNLEDVLGNALGSW